MAKPIGIVWVQQDQGVYLSYREIVIPRSYLIVVNLWIRLRTPNLRKCHLQPKSMADNLYEPDHRNPNLKEISLRS